MYCIDIDIGIDIDIDMIAVRRHLYPEASILPSSAQPAVSQLLLPALSHASRGRGFEV